MKKLIGLTVFVVLIFSGVFAYMWWGKNIQPPSTSSEEVRFVIPKGASAQQIAGNLEEANLINSALAFKIYVQVTGKSDKIQAGEYTIKLNLSLSNLVNELTEGPDEIWATIPEGIRREEIVQRIINSLKMDALQAETFNSEFLLLSEEKEGYLFPDTYLFPKDITASKVISILSNTFESRTKPLMTKLINNKTKEGLNFNEVITLASLLERETKTDERPVVAGILLNRLNAEWPLQVDAAVQYAITNVKLKSQNPVDNYWQPLSKSDLEVDSQYNTYRYNGLPPSPIANPGLASIEAAVSPEITQYWFYLHDSEGAIHYATTLEEHNRNVRTYLGK